MSFYRFSNYFGHLKVFREYFYYFRGFAVVSVILESFEGILIILENLGMSMLFWRFYILLSLKRKMFFSFLDDAF